MRGHQQSNSRRLIKHWQSGNKDRLIASFYMHCNWPANVNSPGIYNQRILIPQQSEGSTININIDRHSQSDLQANLQHLSTTSQNLLFPKWYTWSMALGYYSESDRTPVSVSEESYYGELHEEHFKDIFYRQNKYKMINLFCGAFDSRNIDGLIYSFFDYIHTRLTLYGPITFEQPWSPSGTPPGYSESEWPILSELYSKVHLWVPHPSTENVLFNPGTYMGRGAIRDDEGTVIQTNVSYNTFPGVFKVFDKIGTTLSYKDYMEDAGLFPHLHLPIEWEGTSPFTSPSYVREYVPDYHGWTLKPMQGDYTKYIFIGGPVSNPTSSSEWYNRSFREWMPVGYFTVHYDIDNTLTIEENMRNYANQIR